MAEPDPLAERVRLVMIRAQPFDILTMVEFSADLRSRVATAFTNIEAIELTQCSMLGMGDQIEIKYFDTRKLVFRLMYSCMDRESTDEDLRRSFGGLNVTLVPSPFEPEVFDVVWMPRVAPHLSFDILRYLTSIFPAAPIRVNLISESLHIILSRRQSWLTEFERICLKEMNSIPFDEQEVGALLNKFNTEGLFYVSETRIVPHRLDGITHISLHSASFVNIDYLKQMRNRTVWMAHPNFSPHMFEEFVEHWLSGGSPMLLSMFIFFKETYIPFTLRRVKYQAYDYRTRPQRFRFTDGKDMFNIDCGKHVDIVRSDGALASFLVYADDEKCAALSFFVWNKMQPDEPTTSRWQGNALNSPHNIFIKRRYGYVDSEEEDDPVVEPPELEQIILHPSPAEASSSSSTSEQVSTAPASAQSKAASSSKKKSKKRGHGRKKRR